LRQRHFLFLFKGGFGAGSVSIAFCAFSLPTDSRKVYQIVQFPLGRYYFS